jgi:ABC-type Fe3+-hydroxamate transport system substrate-binding protein
MNRGFILFLGLVLLLTACSSSAPSNVNTSSAPPPTPAGPAPSPLEGFEKDLQYIRNGQYTYVWVFSRKDGKPLEPTDSIFLRTNAPQVVDWVTTDGGKKVIAGTNFNLEEGNLEVLKKRYNAEDYSNR